MGLFSKIKEGYDNFQAQKAETKKFQDLMDKRDERLDEIQKELAEIKNKIQYLATRETQPAGVLENLNIQKEKLLEEKNLLQKGRFDTLEFHFNGGKQLYEHELQTAEEMQALESIYDAEPMD